MIDTAGTICHAAGTLAEAGAVEVHASCTIQSCLVLLWIIFKNRRLKIGCAGYDLSTPRVLD